MSPKPEEIFRAQSLERLASPDRLDQLLRVVGPQAWIAWVACAAVLGAGVVWGVVGRVPETVEGVGYLLHPHQIVGFQAPANGQIERFELEVGAEVRPGDLLASLRLPELEKQLELERIRLDQTRALAEELQGLEAELVERERELLRRQEAALARRIESLERDGAELDQRTRDFLAQQRANLAGAGKVSTELLRELESLSTKMTELEQDQQASLLEGIDARARRAELELRVGELAVAEQELELQDIVAVDTANRRAESIEDLDLRREELGARSIALERRLAARLIEDRARIQEVERSGDLLPARPASESRVESQWDGWVLEVSAARGDRVGLGARLGKIKLRQAPSPLTALCYFSVAEGKRIRGAHPVAPGAPALVTPSTVERARHGGIRGVVGAVSEFPVTTEAAAHQLGDLELARALLGGQSRIEVRIDLASEPRSPDGLAWSSGRSPSGIDVSAGTTAFVRVTVGSRAPITFVLPFLRDLLGWEPAAGA